MSEKTGVARGWNIFFYIAAAYNLVIGLAGMVTPAASVDARIVGLLVLCFGIVYFLVARDPIRFGSVLWAGVVGKAGVVGLLAPQAFGAEGNSLIAGILVGDVLFAIGFLAFLFTRPEGEG